MSAAQQPRADALMLFGATGDTTTGHTGVLICTGMAG